MTESNVPRSPVKICVPAPSWMIETPSPISLVYVLLTPDAVAIVSVALSTPLPRATLLW